jgi:hypothetical protein
VWVRGLAQWGARVRRHTCGWQDGLPREHVPQPDAALLPPVFSIQLLCLLHASDITCS